MEEILSKLLVADNEIIRQGTAELREAFTKPGVVGALCNVVVSSNNPQIRQYACVLLRKRLSKSKYWNKLTGEERNMVKQGILSAFVNEPEKTVKTSIAQFIGSILKHEMPQNTWPELIQFLQDFSTSGVPAQEELGVFFLSILTEMAPKQFLSRSAALCQLLGNTMNRVSEQDLASPIIYYTIRTLTHLSAVSEEDQHLMKAYDDLLPLSVRVVGALAHNDVDKALEVMDFWSELLENIPLVVVPHMKLIIGACLDIAKESSLGDELRIKAVSLIADMVVTKKKTVLKSNMVQPILEVLFVLMSSRPDDESEEEYFADDDEPDSLVTTANQCLDVMAFNMPPEKILPHVLAFVEPSLQGTDLYRKKAAYLAMAVLAEGCADFIRKKYLEQFLSCVCNGIADEAPVVRNAALFALGQFAEHLLPEMSEHAGKLLPVLFQYLQQLCSTLQQQGEAAKDPPGIDRVFYALENVCETLGENLVPYLPRLMESLLIALSLQSTVNLRELALSAVSSAANAVKEEMVPYFPKIIEVLKYYLLSPPTEETMNLHAQAIDTLGALARTIGEDTFRPLAQESLQLAMNLLEHHDDPDIRKSVYGLIASISTVIREDISYILSKVVEIMFNTLQSQEGILTEFKGEEETAAFPVYEDLTDDPADEEDIENDSDESDDSDIAAFNIENSYIEEKEQACHALGELAKNTGLAFTPYINQSFEEVFKMANFPHPDMRQAAIDSLTQICLSYGNMKNNQSEQELLKALSILIPKCSEIIRTDDDRDVVMSALDAFLELLQELKGVVLVGEGHKDAIINCISDVLAHKTECQENEEVAQNADDEDDDDESAELDEILLESAINILPQLGKAMPTDEFAQHFESVFPVLLGRVKKSGMSARSSAIGTIAESIEPLGPHVTRYFPQIFQLMVQMIEDENEEVRNNSIFGLGELVLHGKELAYQHYSQLLQLLSHTLSKENDPRTLDNICGALSRMVVTNIDAIPMDQVFPVFMQHLPLRKDFAEYNIVFQCLALLYQMGHPAMLSHIVPILKIAMLVLYKGQHPDQETLCRVVNLVGSIKSDFPNEFNSAMSELTAKQTETLWKCLNDAASKS